MFSTFVNKLSNGVIIIWGRITTTGTVAAGETKTVNFNYPIVFPAKCLRTVTSTSYSYSCSTAASDLTKCTVTMRNLTTSTMEVYAMMIIGIGY